ncbi:hypothetical protein ABE85_08970 [Mitsuaria sp. 7]|nr:hypothetical protein ABE85_08970 [Mitsuaria sp. 7]
MAQDADATPWLGLLPPLGAALYPLPLAVFHAHVEAARAGGILDTAIATASLSVAFLIPLLALLAVARLLRGTPVTTGQLRARRVALLAVSAPACFVVVGVFSYVAGVSDWDRWLLAVFWASMAVYVARGDRARPLAPTAAGTIPGWLPRAHGAAALAFILMFLAWHLGNHLLGLLGDELHRSVMHTLRHVYRSPWVEPVVLGLGAFLVVSGLTLAWRASRRQGDFLRALQLSAGVYLAVALPSHVNSVLYFARSFLRIESDWDFAVGAPTGLIGDPWNIRLVPYYALAVAAVITHAFCGLRMVLVAHGVSDTTGRRLVAAGTGLAVVVATAIMFGMCGLRL